MCHSDMPDRECMGRLQQMSLLVFYYYISCYKVFIKYALLKSVSTSAKQETILIDNKESMFRFLVSVDYVLDTFLLRTNVNRQSLTLTLCK